MADAGEIHPAALVTVYENVPADNPGTVVFVPVPVVFIAPGILVNVQIPVAGKPVNSTLPVATAQVGCVMVPIAGVAGFPFTLKI